MNFVKSLKGGKIFLLERNFKINENRIAEVIDLLLDGTKFFKDRELLDMVIKKNL